MTAKKSTPHVYSDVNVTPERLTAFAVASRMEQVKVLASLRAQAAEDSGAAKLGLASVVVATLVVILAPLLAIDVDDRVRNNPLAVGVVVTVIVAVLLLAFAPAMFDLVRDQVRHERASVWLGAFEDELARRHRLSGWAARRWQREH